MSSTTKKKARRFVRAVGIAHPRSRRPEDGPESILMTSEEQERCAQNYAGSKLRIRHYDGSPEMDVGSVVKAWVYEDNMYTMFDIDRDWKKPWALQAGTYVLNGLFDGLSTNTMASRNQKTGEIYSNCVENQPVLDLSLCPLGAARRGKDCRIIAKWEMEEDDQGNVRMINESRSENIPLTDKMPPVSTKHHAYNHSSKVSDQNSSSPILFSQMASTPAAAAAAAAAPATPVTPATPQPPQTPSSTHMPRDDPSSATPSQGHKRKSPSDAADAAADNEQKISEAMANLSKLATGLANGGSPSTGEAAVKMNSQLQQLMERVEQLEQEKKETTERIAKENLEKERKRIKALVDDVLIVVEEAMKESGQDPASNPTLNALKSVDKAKTMEELEGLSNAALFAQQCAMPLKHRAMERDRALQRAETEAKSAMDAKQAIAATSAHMAGLAQKVAAQVKQSNTDGINSRIPGAYNWPGNNNNNNYNNYNQQNLPPTNTYSGSASAPPPAAPAAAAAAAAAASSASSTDTTAPMETNQISAAASEKLRHFVQTPTGDWDLKIDFRPDPRLSSDIVLPADTNTVLRKPVLANSVIEHARPVEFGEKGMQFHNPGFFLDMLQQASHASQIGFMPFECKNLAGRKFSRPINSEILPDQLLGSGRGNFNYQT